MPNETSRTNPRQSPRTLIAAGPSLFADETDRDTSDNSRPTISFTVSSCVIDEVARVAIHFPSRSTVIRSVIARISSMRCDT